MTKRKTAAAPRKRVTKAAAPAISVADLYGSNTPYIDVYRKQKRPDAKKLLEAYRDTPYFCANLNARGVARVPLRLYVRTGKGQRKALCPTRSVSSARLKAFGADPWIVRKMANAENVEEVTDHPLLDLLNMPCVDENGIPLMSRGDLFEITELYQEIVGRAFWLIERSGLLGSPMKIWLLNPANMTIKSEKRLIDYYEYQVGPTTQRLEPEDVIFFRFPDPNNPYTGGLSPLEATFGRVNVSEGYLGHQQAWLDNKARPDAMVSPEEQMGPAEVKRLERMLNSRFRGGGSGGLFVNGTKLNFTPLTFAPRDMAALMEANATVEQICRAFDTPLSMVNKDSTRANAEEGRSQHATDAILPRCSRLQETLNARLVPMFDDSGRLFLAYDDPVPENRQLEADLRAKALGTGEKTINECRQEEGFEPVDWGNEPWLASSLRQPSEERPQPPSLQPKPGNNKDNSNGIPKFVAKALEGASPVDVAIYEAAKKQLAENGTVSLELLKLRSKE